MGKRHSLQILVTGVMALIAASCSEEQQEVNNSAKTLEEFIPIYNRSIDQWVAEQKSQAETDLKAKQGELEAAGTDQERSMIQSEISDLRRQIDKMAYRQTFEGYFSLKTEADIPAGLQWQDGMDQPSIGDPDAIKGGRFSYFIETFPPTLRRFGPKANSSFRGRIYDDIDIPLVGIHPLTGQFIPGVAHKWALGPDKQTVFYEIDPDARYTDDTPITAKDFLRGVFVRVSDYVVEPYFRQFFREEFANFTVYSDRLLSISLPEPKPMMPMYATGYPASEKFYADYGPDFTERYQWKAEPIAGAYYIGEDGLKKGRSVTLTRKKDWWAKDKKFYRYMFNPDEINYLLVRNTSKAFEMFRAGDIDYFPLTFPDYWYRKSEIPPVFDGYIRRYTFYNQYPRVPRGLYLNVMRGLLGDRDVRVGIAYATNWQRVIDVIFQGDYVRMNNFTEGFGEFTNPAVKARPYSISKARESFAKAGFTVMGSDGILQRPDGTRLSVSITFPAIPEVFQMMSILKEEARKVGLEFRLDGLEPNVAFKKSSDKKHEIIFTGWGVTPPFPRYYQFLHSSNGVTKDGKPKPDTNNIFCYADPKMDRLVVAMRNATTTEMIKESAWEAQQIIHDEALYIPGYVTDFIRIGSWRWLRWPDQKEMPFSPPQIYEPLDNYMFWIDPEIKRETLAAKREGRKLPEVQETVGAFRNWSMPLSKDLPEAERDVDESSPEGEGIPAEESESEEDQP